jgi:hypothetical protein
MTRDEANSASWLATDELVGWITRLENRAPMRKRWLGAPCTPVEVAGLTCSPLKLTEPPALRHVAASLYGENRE